MKKPTKFKHRTQAVIEPTVFTHIDTPPKWFAWQPWLGVGIFIQAFVATIGSLYYSTFGDPVLNFANGNLFPFNSGLEPCLLCWFARILMYPIAIISYMGIAKRDKHFTDYVLPLSIIGVFLEAYHYALQKLPIHSIFGCSLENPCSALQVNYFGFITIPFLALTAFIVITTLAVANAYINWKTQRNV
jgi:hypothetical protein